MLLNPTPLTSDRFTWVLESRTFVAEASDFGRTFNFGRVYDDAADLGLTLVSSRRPGQKIVFAIDRVERDADNDIIAWHLTPAPYQPAARDCNFTVTIFND